MRNYKPLNISWCIHKDRLQHYSCTTGKGLCTERINTGVNHGFAEVKCKIGNEGSYKRVHGANIA